MRLAGNSGHKLHSATPNLSNIKNNLSNPLDGRNFAWMKGDKGVHSQNRT